MFFRRQNLIDWLKIQNLLLDPVNSLQIEKKKLVDLSFVLSGFILQSNDTSYLKMNLMQGFCCIQGHNREVLLWEIFMEQELIFGLDLGGWHY